MTGARYYAHSKHGAPQEQWEPLDVHLQRVAAIAADFARPFGAADWGCVAGLWHDVGKYARAFQQYLAASGAAEDDTHRAELRGTVDHSTAGAQHAAARGPIGRVLAYCIAGHHAGLPDGEGGMAALSARLQKSVEPYPDAPRELLDVPLPSAPRLHVRADAGRPAFAIAFFTRMVFSCLVDADFLATEEFLSPEAARLRTTRRAELRELLDTLECHLDQLERGASDTPVNRERKAVLASCRTKAELAPGFFSLHVPTGGGKTLSSLAFALRHATRHGLRRIIYAIPFTSIIEQTANVFRQALGVFRDQVLEHHSNLEPADPARQSEQSRLAAENFDAPLIVTTNVQLFDSLFSCRTSRCRKLHRLARSVIILDEAQALPPNLLAPTLAALEELVTNYGATVVLCTATQPAIERRPGFPIGLSEVRPIIDDPVRVHRTFRRTVIEMAGRVENRELAERLRDERQVLCIVNSRGHAVALFELLQDPGALHLSANMCGAHRSDVLAEIRRRLAAGEPCRVVSTQVVEAGVDLDFPVVYRAAAGLDSIAQAAGRCNREGVLRDAAGNPRFGRVVVFDHDEGAHRPPPFIRRAAAHFREVAPDHDGDLLSPAAVEAYFRLHYWQQGGDFGSGWDRGRGGESVMRCFGGTSGDPLHHQFRQAAERYQFLDEAQVPVVVPFGMRGLDLVRTLLGAKHPPDMHFDRNAQRYVVSVWPHALRSLVEHSVVIERHGRFCLGNERAYDLRIGLRPEAVGLDPSILIQ